MPWRAWSSAYCNWSRLDWIAAEASSRIFSADLLDSARRRNSSDSTSREVEAPIAGGEQMFGVADEQGVRLLAGARPTPRSTEKRVERALRARCAPR